MKNELPDSTSALASQIELELGLEKGFLPREDGDRLLLEHVARVVEELMGRNPGEFFNMLYIMDVDELAIRKILEGELGEHSQASFAIAQLIIDREWRKVESRIKYRNWETPEEDW